MAIDAWFSDLYKRNYVLLYRVGRIFLGYDPVQEALTEDQIQETFIRAWQKRFFLKKHPNPDGWIYINALTGELVTADCLKI